MSNVDKTLLCTVNTDCLHISIQIIKFERYPVIYLVLLLSGFFFSFFFSFFFFFFFGGGGGGGGGGG